MSEKPPVLIQAPLFRADHPTPSGKIYPREVLEAAAAEIKPYIATRRVLGEFGPGERSLMDPVDPARASHLVTSLAFKGDVFVAGLEVLEDNEQGARLVDHLRNEGEIVVIPRATGTAVTEGDNEKVNSYILITVDVYPVGEFGPVDGDEDEGGND